jgi:hypothetical protein
MQDIDPIDVCVSVAGILLLPTTYLLCWLFLR